MSRRSPCGAPTGFLAIMEPTSDRRNVVQYLEADILAGQQSTHGSEKKKSLQRSKSMQADEAEEEGNTQHQGMNITRDRMRKLRRKAQNGRKQQVLGQ